MNIKSHPTFDLDDINTISLALRQYKEDQRHIGILYKDKEAITQLLHLEWYEVLTKSEPDDNYIWIDVELDPILKITLSTWCEVIYNKNKGGIPYDIDIKNTGFDEQGVFDQETEYAGLTCATFVLKVFNSHGINLIDFSSWPVRIEDKKWQEKILNLLIKNIPKLLNARYLSQKLKDISSGIQRIKPEEVAAAAALENYPHSQSTLKSPSQQIVDFLNK